MEYFLYIERYLNMINEVLQKSAEAAGLSLTLQMLEKFGIYEEYLEKRNREVNLTAVKGENEIALRHFIDSMMLSKAVELNNASMIDVGTGAGFPGLPLKIFDDSIKLTLLDSHNKRIDFLKELCALLNVEAESIHGRAEELSLQADRRDSYSYAVSRALARLNVLCELCMPFVKPGGAFLAMKASHFHEELKESENAVKLLGGFVEKVYEYEVAEIKRSVIIIRKECQTPEGYPRRYAKIEKSPL